MALHAGEVELDGQEYRGLVLHRAAYLLTAAQGGQILCSQAVAELVRRDLKPELRLRELGIFCLRDIPGPERLFQVDYPNMPVRDFPPPNAGVGYAANLPLQFTRFFGRETEIARIVELLAPAETSGQVRLVTLTAPGGTGKTRLAIEAARQLQEAFSGRYGSCRWRK